MPIYEEKVISPFAIHFTQDTGMQCKVLSIRIFPVKEHDKLAVQTGIV